MSRLQDIDPDLGEELSFPQEQEAQDLGETLSFQGAATVDSLSPDLGAPLSLEEAFQRDIPGQDETLGRIGHGINAIARRLGTSLVRDVPQLFSVLGQKAGEATREAREVSRHQIETGENLQDITPENLEQIKKRARQFGFDDLEQDPLFRFGRNAGEAVEEMFPNNPEFQGEFWADVLPSAVGDVGALLLGRGAGRLVPGVIGVAQISTDEFRQAKEKGATEEEAFQTFLLNLPVGATEAIPVGLLFKRLDTVTGGGVKKVLAGSFKGGIEEMVQEVIQTSASNLIAGNVYDDTRDLFDGLGDAASGGFGAGLILNAMGLSLRQATRGTPQAAPADPETGPSTEAAVAAVRQDITQEIRDNPDLSGEDLIDWEVFSEQAVQGLQETEPGQLKDPDLFKQEDVALEERDTQDVEDIIDILKREGIFVNTKEEAQAKQNIAKERLELEGRVASSQTVSPNVSGLVSDLTELFPISRPIRIVNSSDVGKEGDSVGQSVPRIIEREASSLGRANGAYFFDSETDTHFLFVNDLQGQPGTLLGETISHEVGHLVMTDLSLDPKNIAPVAGLKALHKDAIEGLRGRTMRDVLTSYRNPTISMQLYEASLRTAKEQGLSKDQFDRMTFSEFERLDKRTYDYVTSLEEWTADQFGKWVATAPNKRDVSSRIGKYFQALFERLKQVYQKFFDLDQLKPDASFEFWLERFLQPRPEAIPVDEGIAASDRLRFDRELQGLIFQQQSATNTDPEVASLLRDYKGNRTSFLEEAVREGNEASTRLRGYTEPVRAYLRSTHGDTITLHRGQRGFDPTGKELFSFSTDIDTARRFEGVSRNAKLISIEVPIDNIVHVGTLPPIGEGEFIVRATPDLVERLSADSGANTLRFSRDLVPPPPPTSPPGGLRALPPPAGDPDPRQFNINPDDLNTGLRGKAWRQFINWLAPRGRLSQAGFEIAQRERAMARSEVREAFGRIREVQALIKEEFPDGMTTSVEANIDTILRGRVQEARRILTEEASGISPNLRSNLVRMRRQIDRLSTTLIQEGAVSGPLAARIAANIGTYLHRQYRVHTDPSWTKNVPLDVIQRAKHFIRDRYEAAHDRSITPRELDNAIELLLTNNDIQQALLLGDKLKAKNLGILIPRKGVPAPIRALWGEIESPLYNYFESVRKISDLISYQRGVAEIRDTGKGTYFFPEDELFTPAGYTATIQAGLEDPLHPLAGWRTHPEILAALKRSFGEFDYPSNWWHQAFLKANGLVKLGKVPYNPMTVMRNFYGGTMFLMANGHSPLQIAKRGKRILSAITDKGVNQNKQRYTELGLLDESLIQGETLDALRDLNVNFDEADLLGNLDPFKKRSPARRWLLTALREPLRFYNGIDSFLRISFYEAELAQQTKARYPNGIPTEIERTDLEEQVAQQIKDTYQNYSQVPRAIRALRQNILVGPFVSFPYEAIRTAVNTVRVARQEINSDNPSLRAIGWKRAVALTSTVFAGTALTLTTQAMLGIDDETEDDIEQLLAPWDRNVGKMYTGIEDGKVRYTNVGYTFPYTILERPLMTIWRRGDDNLFEAGTDAITQFFGEFLGVELTTGITLDLLKNKKSGTESEIWNPVSSDGQKLADVFAYVAGKAQPGIINLTVTRPIKEGPDFEPGHEAWQIMSGMKKVELDVNRSFMFKAIDFSKDRQRVRRIANRVIFDEDASQGDKDNAIAEAQRIYADLWGDLQDLYDSAFRLGVDPADLEQSLEQARIGKSLREDLLRGGFQPLEFELP